MAEPEEDETAFDASADEDEDEALDEDDLPAVLDLSNVEPATFEVIPKGIYPGYIDEIEYGRSQTSNKLQLIWKIKVEYEDKERTLRWYTGLEGDSLPRTLASLQKLDPELDLANFEPDAMDEHFGGWEVMVRVTIRPDREDRKIKRNNVADVFLPEE